MQGVGFLLLAGGQSRRMGGGDKNQLQLAGKSVLQHVLDRVDRGGDGDPQPQRQPCATTRERARACAAQQ